MSPPVLRTFPLRLRLMCALRAAVAVVLAGLGLVIASAPALAHPALIETVPGAGYAVTSPPEAVIVTFNERVTPVAEALTLQLADGTPVTLDVELTRDGTSLRGVPGAPLEPGSYEVSYDVVALDGDVIEGAFPFGVATPVEAGSSVGGLSQDDPDRVRPGTAAPRALLFLGLSLALGGLVGVLLVRRSTGRASPVPPLVVLGATAGLAGALLLLGQLVGFDVARLGAAVRSSSPAQLLAAEVVLLALALTTGRRRSRGVVAGVALLGVVLLEGVRAHPGEALGSVGITLTVVHLAAAAVWAGALVHVIRVAVAWRGTSLATWVAVGAYARLAIALLALVAATGTLSALLLLPSLQDWTTTTYGQVLLVKLVLFGAVLAAAAIARTRHRRAVDDGTDVLDRRQRPWVLSSAAKVEAALLAALVVVTAGLTSATPPRLVSQTALLPAPTGAVVRVAERAEQVSVAVVASAGRLEARAYAPGPEGSNRYSIELAHRRPDGSRERLDLSGCGNGCWTSSVEWVDGLNEVIGEVEAAGWTGGVVSLTVPWPPQPSADLLRTVQAVMGAQKAIRTTEVVTSGFGDAPTTTSVRTGQEYLEDEPWADGGVTDPVVYRTSAGERVLVFALPPLGYHFQFTLDDQDRVVSSRAVTQNHLLLRDYSYVGS
jgi:copper transport protein